MRTPGTGDAGTRGDGGPAGGEPEHRGDDQFNVRRARIEEIRPLAEEYGRESSDRSRDGVPSSAPIPEDGIYWIASQSGTADEVGYAAGVLRPDGLTIGPVYVRPGWRRRGVGWELLQGIQRWAEGTRIPVVEVSVDVDNQEGRAFLEAGGYVARRILFVRTGHPSGDDSATR